MEPELPFPSSKMGTRGARLAVSARGCLQPAAMHLCMCVHVCTCVCSRLQKHTWTFGAGLHFPRIRAAAVTMRGRRRGKKGGGGTCRKRGCSGARARTRTERCGQRETAYSGGEPDMGWRYRGEVGALVGRGGRGGHKWGNPFQSVI